MAANQFKAAAAAAAFAAAASAAAAAQQNAQNEEEEKIRAAAAANGGVIITEVTDDEDDEEFKINKDEKKKDYVDAISLNGDDLEQHDETLLINNKNANEEANDTASTSVC